METVQIVLVLSAGLDRVTGQEMFLDICLNSIMTLNAIEEGILNILTIQEGMSELSYVLQGRDKTPLDKNTSLAELGIRSGDRIFVGSVGLDHLSKLMKKSQTIEVASLIKLTCTTRILDAYGMPIRKLCVVVDSTRTCDSFMKDVGTLWAKSGLKFKCGRTVLSAEKTFDELGVVNDSEIVITGGRS